MSLKLKIKVELSEDKKILSVSDDGTDWSTVMKQSITKGVLNLYTKDKTLPLKEVTLTTSELSNFLNNQSGVSIPFSDTRMFDKDYADDEYYDVKLILNDGTTDYESNGMSFSVDLELSKKVYTTIESTYFCSSKLIDMQRLTQAVILLDVLSKLSTEQDRELKWRDIYGFINNNIENMNWYDR